MNTPSAKADGFSAKLCGNPLAYRLTDSSCRKTRPLQHDQRSSHIAVEGASAITAVHPFGERLASDRAALRARLRSPARIDQLDHSTGAFSLVLDMLDELVPRGVVHGLGQHPCRQSFDIQILHRDVREASDDRCGQLVREIPALAGRLGAVPSQPGFNLPSPEGGGPQPEIDYG